MQSKGGNRKSHYHSFCWNSYPFIRFAYNVFHRRENRDFFFRIQLRGNIIFQRFSCEYDSCRKAEPLFLSSDVFSLRWRGQSAILSWMPLTWLPNVSTDSCGICTSLNLIYLRPPEGAEELSQPSIICSLYLNFTFAPISALPHPSLPNSLGFIFHRGATWYWEWDEIALLFLNSGELWMSARADKLQQTLSARLPSRLLFSRGDELSAAGQEQQNTSYTVITTCTHCWRHVCLWVSRCYFLFT